MNYSEQRKKMRSILAGSQCLSPARIYDPLSACVAAHAGYEFGLLAGSAAANTTLAAPDGLALLTLTEFADLIRRIVRASKISLLADADHGYGNALNVMRTVQELEHAGVGALSIEDTALPRRFGQPDSKDEVISTEEMVGKLRAAVAARQDPSLVIAGRISALTVEGAERTLARVLAYAATGVDAIFLIRPQKIEHIAAIHAATKLPIILGSKAPDSSTNEQLAAAGVRVHLPGHEPLAAAAKALRETYAHLFNAGAPAELKAKIATEQEVATLVNNENYKQWGREYLGR